MAKLDTKLGFFSSPYNFRLNDKQFSIWVKDSLVKQGHTTAKAEALLKSVTSTGKIIF